MTEANVPKRKKVTILGGGMGAMAVAFALTDPDNPYRDQYEVTVYQLGWRLGGKGASGRNQQMGDRIEEHGLHIWFGFYNNAFAMIRKCYTELNRPPGAPLRTWQDAFKPHNLVVIQEFHNNQWKTWPFNFPAKPGTPGQPSGCLPSWDFIGKTWPFNFLPKLGTLDKASDCSSPWDFIEEIVEWLHQNFMKLPQARALPGDEAITPPVVDRVIKDVAGEVETIGLSVVGAHLTRIHALVQALDDDVHKHRASHHNALFWLWEKFIEALQCLAQEIDQLDDDLRRLWILMELGAVCAYGMLKDGVIFHGFQVIDDCDFREWLLKRGASEMVAYSAPVRASLYDGLFAYPGGDMGDKVPSDKGDLAAGTALHAAMLTISAYKGAVMWKMQSGMGDTIFAPLYEVLKSRGVQFIFFNKVKALHLGLDHTIERISIGRQATVKQGPTAYNPLIEVKGLPCWPNQPLYDQLEEGQALQDQQINLESAWTPWPDVGEITLERDKDFDLVVLGISLGALKDICAELYLTNSKWRDMLDQVQTVQTQAFQVWLSPDLEGLGWPLASPVMAAYVDPFNSWADMSQTLPTENWPPEQQPGNVSYFCGPLPEAVVTPPFKDPGFPAREDRAVERMIGTWLQQNTGHLWPKATPPGNPNGLNEALVISQFERANIDPSERYVLSVKNSSQYRLKADGSGYSNLYLTGDWIQNGLNFGAVEPTVISGLLASRAISGFPQQIICEPYIP